MVNWFNFYVSWEVEIQIENMKYNHRKKSTYNVVSPHKAVDVDFLTDYMP